MLQALVKVLDAVRLNSGNIIDVCGPITEWGGMDSNIRNVSSDNWKFGKWTIFLPIQVLHKTESINVKLRVRRKPKIKINKTRLASQLANLIINDEILFSDDCKSGDEKSEPCPKHEDSHRATLSQYLLFWLRSLWTITNMLLFPQKKHYVKQDKFMF